MNLTFIRKVTDNGGSPTLWGVVSEPVTSYIHYEHWASSECKRPLAAFMAGDRAPVTRSGGTTPTSAVGGVGGHPDYAAAATNSVGGLSIIAIPSTHKGRPVLVPRLSRPVCTPAHDIDVVVTERGLVDLRGLSRPERRQALARLWRLQSTFSQ